ncbi:MAG TPA: ABC-F family ATP-binding cassette domain-containing protein [Roseiflexaceae bacterium]|nr:ABC-F family ATP-binding cassette domain-containing protein [Roseiflexaceae bacterium]HMP42396.1 ABC-F family ATP-binding cassette domain-containing protein [Roseiflexaceae bacterium]
MLHVQKLRKDYGAATILADISFLINDGEHVGLIGANGAGKTTLLRCILGYESPDDGVIVRTPPDLVIGYLTQTIAADEPRAIGALLDEAQAELHAAALALDHAATALANATADQLTAALEAYDAALATFEVCGGYEREQRAAAVLDGLGLGAIDRATPVGILSGGQKTRLGLALLLLREPELLLLDEPTNHLDIEALTWLESFVQSYPRAVLVVSHDREFLNRTVGRILYLDAERHTLASYSGSYDDYAAARAHERSQQEQAWQDQQLYIASVESDISRIKGRAQNIQNGPKRGRDYYGGVSAKVARLARTRERKLARYLEADDRVEKPRQRWEMKLDFGPPPPGGRAVLHVADVAFGYPGSQQLFRDVAFDVQHGERIAIVGPNGAGKTTLLRLLAGRLTADHGSIRLGTNVRPGLLAQEQETLDLQRSVLATALHERAMSETEARSFLHLFLFGGDSVFRQVGLCSPGERARLQLALLVLRGCNLLLLDEPLNHLDIEGREHFEDALAAFEGTVIAISHDRAFLRGFAERIIEVRNGHVRDLALDYDEYVRIHTT